MDRPKLQSLSFILSPQHFNIVVLHIFKGVEQAEVARIAGISQQRVSQIISQSIPIMRDAHLAGGLILDVD